MTREKRRHYQTEEMSLVNFANKRKQEHLLQVLNFNTKPLVFLGVQIQYEGRKSKQSNCNMDSLKMGLVTGLQFKVVG